MNAKARRAVGVLLALFAAAGPQAASPAPLQELFYDKPAAQWTEAVPLGNGRIGAMVFGGIADERIQINEDTLWGGGPRDYVNSHAGEKLAELRR